MMMMQTKPTVCRNGHLVGKVAPTTEARQNANIVENPDLSATRPTLSTKKVHTKMAVPTHHEYHVVEIQHSQLSRVG